MSSETTHLLEHATQPYRPLGRFAWHFARGKLSGDPIFFNLLHDGLIPDNAHILDIGCGQGLLLSLLAHAEACAAAGEWPDDWPPPPRNLTLHGIELHQREAQWAQQALGNKALIDCIDLRDNALPKADLITLIDVIHYITPAQQQQLLAQIATALPADGLLLMRVADASRRPGVWITSISDWLAAALRGHFWTRLHHRPLDEWRTQLKEIGFEIAPLPMSAGTPFVNVLLVCKRI